MQNGVIDEKLCKDFFTPWARIKGGLSIEHYNVLRDQIADDISKIDILTSKAISLEDSRHQRSRIGNANYWNTVRDHAERLFKKLGSTLSQGCACQCTHRANLKVEISEKFDDGVNEPQVDFGFCFKSDATAASLLSWDWRDVQVLSRRAPNLQ